MQIELQQVSKQFGHFQALKPLSLTIPSGKFTTILGPSGCGKTTLLRMIAGLETPDNGEIRFDAEVVFSKEKRIHKATHKRQLGMVFQDFALWPHLTVFENVAFGLRATRRTSQLTEQVLDAIAAVRLTGFEQRYPNQLSGGQQQRVAFARAIAIQPQLILFDEPLSALDAVLREELRIELTSLVRDRQLTAIYVTHDQTEAMSMSDQVIVMKAGEVLQVGTPETIYKEPSCRAVAHFVGRSNWFSNEQALFRPEHLAWQGTTDDHTWEATVTAVSFVGDRYEVIVETKEHGQWMGYHHQRMSIGESLTIYVSKEHIQLLQERKEVIR